MMNETWEKQARELCDEAKEKRWSIEVFYQDHFYSSRGNFGYPICVNIWPEPGLVCKTYILGWAAYPDTCFAMIEILERFIRGEGLQPQ